MKRLLLAVLAVVVVRARAETVQPLPGEDGQKPALAPNPFPDRMSAFVWRNWGLVDKRCLAEVVGASSAEMTSVAVEMGLASDPVVLPLWKTKGYITVLRRNWHLLPYEQLMKLLGKSREELRFCLQEDDFLWVKLGCEKPRCEELKWRAEALAKSREARRRIAAVLQEEGIDPSAPEEARFAFFRRTQGGRFVLAAQAGVVGV